ELGWEIHHPVEYQRHIFLELLRAGAEFDIGQCGMRAMDSLRIEKSYRMWGQDLTIEYSAFEAGLDRFVALDKGDFVGRKALVAQREAGVPQDFVTLELEADDADPWGNEPIYDGETMIGRVTSGAYGHTVGKSLALGYVARNHAVRGRRLAVEILGERRPARIVPNSPVDPANTRLRA
ncbi:MAG: aminomethyltransferase family protein, partial [Rhodospirillaceae bacterium]|nr:aminomethyltransferase family protein [Rhodospirillaceae bacterium]